MLAYYTQGQHAHTLSCRNFLQLALKSLQAGLVTGDPKAPTDLLHEQVTVQVCNLTSSSLLCSALWGKQPMLPELLVITSAPVHWCPWTHGACVYSGWTEWVKAPSAMGYTANLRASWATRHHT